MLLSLMHMPKRMLARLTQSKLCRGTLQGRCVVRGAARWANMRVSEGPCTQMGPPRSGVGQQGLHAGCDLRPILFFL